MTTRVGERVTIVTISLNQAEFLEDCVRSVLSQEADVEYIVVDGGSTDGSLEILERYRDRIAHLIVGADEGPADALNRGFAHATGDVLGYLNSDDVLLPGALARAVAFFRAAPGIDVVYGDGVALTSDGGRICRLLSAPWDLRGIACAGLHAVQPATFFRREAFERSPGFNTRNPSCWDRELLIDLALSGAEFRYLPEALAGHRVHDGSITGSGRLRSVNARQHEKILGKVLSRRSRVSDHVLRNFYRLRWRLLRPARVWQDLCWHLHPRGRWRGVAGRARSRVGGGALSPLHGS
jgi:glycosyltransferase involved in cell wall biosynthesis